MFAPDGREIGSWLAMRQGTASGMFAPSHASEAAELAMRNAASKVALGFSRQPNIRSWLDAQGLEVGQLTR